MAAVKLAVAESAGPKPSAKKEQGNRRSQRKPYVQQSLFRRGGKRRGAGRKSRKGRPGRRHERRADFSARQPLHVVLRVDESIGTLRRRAMYKAIREATQTAALRKRIRIVHVSLQRTHIHMIVEAADRELLARGMQGFQVAAAKYINRALARRGRVFVDRYYVEIITTPTQALRAISYVLNNWRRHAEDQSGTASRWLIDPFSSAAQFHDWRESAARGAAWCGRVGWGLSRSSFVRQRRGC